jgi:RNA polymerase sigma-70 factor (ECF subfamily)
LIVTGRISFQPAGVPAVPAHPPPTPEADTDGGLLKGCLAREPRAWEAFIDRFGGLFAHVAGRTADRRRGSLSTAEREDVVAEILLECLRNDAAVLRRFAGRSSLSSYLTVVARRVAVRHLVRNLDAFRAAVAGGGRPVATTPAAPRLDDREQVALLLDRLEPEEARLVRLHHLEARSYGEISNLTGLPLGSIGPVLSRARVKLRAMMESPATG